MTCIKARPFRIIIPKGSDIMQNNDKPQIPIGLGSALAENTSALKYFSELSSEKQRRIIDCTNKMGSRAEIRTFVRNMTGLGNLF